MRKKRNKLVRPILLTFLLPLLAGCQGGGSDLASLIGSLLGGSGGTNAGILSLLDSSTSSIDGEVGLAAVHNPEPASMLLLGGGMAAMAYFNKKFCKV